MAGGGNVTGSLFKHQVGIFYLFTNCTCDSPVTSIPFVRELAHIFMICGDMDTLLVLAAKLGVIVFDDLPAT